MNTFFIVTYESGGVMYDPEFAATAEEALRLFKESVGSEYASQEDPISAYMVDYENAEGDIDNIGIYVIRPHLKKNPIYRAESINDLPGLESK